MAERALRVVWVEAKTAEVSQFVRLAPRLDPSHVLLIAADRMEDAVQRLRTTSVDAVVLGWSAPGESGLQRLTAIRAVSPAIPVIVLLASANEAMVVEALSAGAQECVVAGRFEAADLPGLVRRAQARKLVEEQLREANRHLERVTALKDEFVAAASHELRTPLTAMKEGLALVLEQKLGPTTAEQQDFLRTVDRDLDRLTELVSNMLDLSKIETGHLHLSRRRTMLAPLLDQALDTHKTLLGRRRVTVQAVEAAVFGDPDRLLQVLGNLIANAIKFTKPDGMIRLAVQEGPEAVAVSVQDDGVGISREDQARLFHKFSQVGPEDQRRRGTGLGLALCKQLVELHRGEIRVASEPSRGSTFTFTVPRYSPQFALTEHFRELVETLAEHDQNDSVTALALEARPSRASELAAVIGAHVHHGDAVIEVDEQWVVILAVADQAGVEAIVRRLSGVLRDRGMPSSRFGAARYPVDGRDVQTLVATAQQRVGAAPASASN